MNRWFPLIICALASGCAIEPAEHGDGSPSISVKKEDVREGNFPALRTGETLDVSFPYFFTDASVGDYET